MDTTLFVPISLPEYIELHLRANPSASRADVVARLQNALEAFRKGTRCTCGEPIWVIGSAEAGYACFTCITGEAVPDSDYELSEVWSKP